MVNSGGTAARNWRTWLTMLVDDPQRLHGAKALKLSHAVQVLQADFPENLGPDQPLNRVVCKRKIPSGLKEKLVLRVRSSDARADFEMARRLAREGIPTARPLAFLERRSPPESWLVSEHLGEAVDLDTVVSIVLPRLPDRRKRRTRIQLASALAELAVSLQRAGLYHRDFKASNILVRSADREDAPLCLCLIDLEGLSSRRPWRSSWKPIVRLAASLLEYSSVTRADYARFLLHYLTARGMPRETWRSLFRIMSRRATRYERKSRARKSGKLDGYVAA